MKKLIPLMLLVAASTFAQRPPKEICLEIREGCTEVDSPEVIELKLVFNSLVGDLDFWLDLRRDFDNAGEVDKRFDDFNAQITVFETVKDVVDDDVVKNLFQTKIDATTKRRDDLHSTKAGSKREQAGGAGNIISQLNLQLNAVEAAIRDI